MKAMMKTEKLKPTGPSRTSKPLTPADYLKKILTARGTF